MASALDNFIPEIWAAGILDVMDDELVYTQPSVVNRDYEGEIASMGDTVRINAVGPATVSSYSRGTAMGDPEQLSNSQTVLSIDQEKYVNIALEVADIAQMNVDMQSRYEYEMGFALAQDMDDSVAAVMAAGVPTAQTLGTTASPKTDLGTAGVAYDYLVDLGTYLTQSNTPREGRWVIVPAWFEGLLRKDADVVASGADAADVRIVNGRVMRLAGFDIVVSNRVPETSTDTGVKIIAGHAKATTVASQLMLPRVLQMENRFALKMDMLHLYGRKVIQPRHLAMLIANRPS